jgi:hypothetical protein
MPADAMSSINGFYRLYKIKGEYSAIFIGENDIYTFNITASNKDAERIITQIHLNVTGNGTLKTDFQNGSSDFQTKVAPLVQAQSTPEIEKILSRYNKFIQKKVP